MQSGKVRKSRVVHAAMQHRVRGKIGRGWEGVGNRTSTTPRVCVRPQLHFHGSQGIAASKASKHGMEGTQPRRRQMVAWWAQHVCRAIWRHLSNVGAQRVRSPPCAAGRGSMSSRRPSHNGGWYTHPPESEDDERRRNRIKAADNVHQANRAASAAELPGVSVRVRCGGGPFGRLCAIR